jgi:Predicted membrane protein (DUF2207).
MIFVGLFLMIFPLYILKNLNELNTSRRKRIFLDIFLGLLAFVYVIFCMVLKTAPFDFGNVLIDDILIYSAVIFTFSPFLWIVLYYFCRKLFRKIRVGKNMKLKSISEFTYYRDDLNKTSPSIIMFTSIMDVDIRKSITAVILKLKLTGHLIEQNDNLSCTNKNNNELLDSEKMILNSFKNELFDRKKYNNLVKKEALQYKYIKKNNNGKLFKVVKIIIIILTPIILISLSQKFDNYVYSKYPIYVIDGVRYLRIYDEKSIDNLYYSEIKDINDYYYSDYEIEEEEKIGYYYDLVKVDKLEYSIVRKRVVFSIVNQIFILLSVVSIFVAIFMIIEQLLYFNKDYLRTMKGNDLLNKTYALKNYLKEFSIIEDKTEKELILWEYYLIYGVILDVNVKIEDTLIDKYLKNKILK